MPEIKDRFKFEPDSNARKIWLGTRKGSKAFGSQTLPGFYDTIEYEIDTSWVLVAACVESVAIGLTLYGGFIKGGIYLLGACIAIILFVVFDIIGATFFHRPKAGWCKINNKILITPDAGVKEGLRGLLKKGKGIQVVGVVLIVLSSLLKIAAILLLGKFNIVFYAIMALLYLLVIYVHISHTGYFLAEWTTRRKFNKQYKIWAQDTLFADEGRITVGDVRYNARILRSPFESDIKLNIEPDKKVEVGNHNISVISTSKKENQIFYTYQIETQGILLDADINLLLNYQNPTQAGIIAIACLKHQVERIH